MRLSLASLLLSTGLALSAAAQETPVTLTFAAQVGGEPFRCGGAYADIGTTKSTVTPSDFRFYVSDVALIRADGTEQPVALTQDQKWQVQTVALLDFEDKTGPCSNGTADTNAKVIGSAPAGAYTGVAFTLGVPFALNHADATLAASPLNLSTLFWNWLGGYKFLRVDMDTSGAAQGQGPKGKERGFVVHLGSTACQPAGAHGGMPMAGASAGGHGAASGAATQPAQSCANPNRARVVLPGFDPAKQVILADLKALLSDTNVDVNQPDTALGCMSAPTDGDCPGIFRALGLPVGGSVTPQRFFKAS